MELGSELIKKLDSVELENYKKSVKNLNDFLHLNNLMSEKYLNLYDLISMSFHWSNSEQGYGYWSEIANR